MERKDSSAMLFRSTLYAPLEAYQQTLVSPAEYTRTSSTKVSKELQESSLYKFLQHVSSHHHTKPTQLHAKNTSAKPLKDYAERIQQRALNLVGRDFYGGGTQAKSHKAHCSTAAKRRQSKQKPQCPKSEEIKLHNSFLDYLNQLWNEYASKVLREKTEMKPAINSMEWIGALVRIDACPAFRDWRGYQGIVVHHTEKSWHVCIRGKTRSKKKKDVNKLLFLPKATTTLTVLILTEIRSRKQGGSEYLCAMIRGENSK